MDFRAWPAMSLIMGISRASSPCLPAIPDSPPGISVGGARSVSPNCGTISADVYATNFLAAEKPLSEGGKWINGQARGLDWHDVQSTRGEAHAAQFATGYDDDIAVLNTSFSANQFAQGTVFRARRYSPSASHEIELLLRFQITAHNARGYEVLWGQTGELNIVRWNGPLGSYTPLKRVTGLNIGAAVDGDLLRAEIVGSVIRVYKNGSLVFRGATNTTWTDGQPGMGFWPKAGATLTGYGWKHFEAGSLF